MIKTNIWGNCTAFTLNDFATVDLKGDLCHFNYYYPWPTAIYWQNAVTTPNL